MSINTGISISMSIGVGVVAVPRWPGFTWFLFYFFQHQRHWPSPLLSLLFFFIFFGFGITGQAHFCLIFFSIFSALASLAKLFFFFFIFFNFFGSGVTGQARFCLHYYFQFFRLRRHWPSPFLSSLFFQFFRHWHWRPPSRLPGFSHGRPHFQSFEFFTCNSLVYNVNERIIPSRITFYVFFWRQLGTLEESNFCLKLEVRDWSDKCGNKQHQTIPKCGKSPQSFT